MAKDKKAAPVAEKSSGSLGTRARASQNRSVRRAKKALRHAQKRGASEYVLERIQTHIQTLLSRGRPVENGVRTANREKQLLREREREEARRLAHAKQRHQQTDAA